LNTDLMFSSKSDLWETPQDFFDRLNEEFHFDLDVCALPENAKCERFYTPEMDGLKQPWEGTCWCNPPYGKYSIIKWVQKADLSTTSGSTVVMLLPARTDTQWFHEFVLGKAEIRFVKGRLKFGGCKKQRSLSVYSGDFLPASGRKEPHEVIECQTESLKKAFALATQ